MPLAEFDIIEEIFKQQVLQRDDVVLGIGDDAAIISVPKEKQLVVAMDTLVAGVHFPKQTSAEDIAYKALAVNLSDLAAMGAEPAWFTLALTLPVSNEAWLRNFAKGLFELANSYNMVLVGGDTTQGPLTVTIQVAGHVPQGKALQRNGAKAGDAIYVTGSLGDAAAGLQCFDEQLRQVNHAHLINRLNRPTPQIEMGLLLRERAGACIDISDGLISDLGHILQQSAVGASLHTAALPISTALAQVYPDIKQQLHLALSGGDDYELCFTLSEEQAESFLKEPLPCPVSCIGRIEAEPGISLLDKNNEPVALAGQKGYEHFSEK